MNRQVDDDACDDEDEVEEEEELIRFVILTVSHSYAYLLNSFFSVVIITSSIISYENY